MVLVLSMAITRLPSFILFSVKSKNPRGGCFRKILSRSLNLAASVSHVDSSSSASPLIKRDRSNDFWLVNTAVHLRAVIKPFLWISSVWSSLAGRPTPRVRAFLFFISDRSPVRFWKCHENPISLCFRVGERFVSSLLSDFQSIKSFACSLSTCVQMGCTIAMIHRTKVNYPCTFGTGY